MEIIVSLTATRHRRKDPAWEVARLFPAQGDWSAADFLVLNRHTNHMAELSDGRVEVLPMPTKSHQQIVLFLYSLLTAFLSAGRLGTALVAPYPMRLKEGKFREPDVLVMLSAHTGRLGEQFADGADLVVEVVSDDRDRDLITKRGEYARAGIPEYWIVDPQEKCITVLKLSGRKYVLHGKFHPGEQASSSILKGFTTDVKAVFAVGQR